VTTTMTMRVSAVLKMILRIIHLYSPRLD